MTLLLRIVLTAIVVLLIVVAGLRLRKLRRDQRREDTRTVDPRLITPPPPPYMPSRGFRLLDESSTPIPRPEPDRPRLETSREYVFSETQLPRHEEYVVPHGRRDELWALSKSVHRSRLSTLGIIFVMILLVLIVVIGAIGYYLQHHRSPGTKSPTATSMRYSVHAATTTTTVPSSLARTSTHDQNIAYSVVGGGPRSSAHVAAGPVWSVRAGGQRVA